MIDVYIRNILPILKGDFEKKLFLACVDSMDSKCKLRFNSFSCGMRELLISILKRMAPDECVRGCSWFKGQRDYPERPTVFERIKFASQGNLTEWYIKNKLPEEYKYSVGIYKSLSENFTLLNKGAHVGEGTFGISDHEFEEKCLTCIKSMSDLSSLIASSKLHFYISYILHIQKLLVKKTRCEIEKQLSTNVLEWGDWEYLSDTDVYFAESCVEAELIMKNDIVVNQKIKVRVDAWAKVKLPYIQPLGSSFSLENMKVKFSFDE